MADGLSFIDVVLVVAGDRDPGRRRLVLQSHHVPRSTYEHGEIAANLLAGRGFTTRFLGPTGHFAAGAVYPALVCSRLRDRGVENPQALLLLELGQAILGGVLVLGVIAPRTTNRPEPAVARVDAGLVSALHPTLVYAATHVQVASLGTTLLVWTLALAYQTGATGGSVTRRLTGVLLALLALTDPILALAVAGVAWAVSRWAAPPSSRSRSFRLLAVIAIDGPGGHHRPGWCETSWFMANSSRSRARSATPSGRATAP